MSHTNRRTLAILLLTTLASALPGHAGTVELRPQAPASGDRWTTLLMRAGSVTVDRVALESAVLWDVRPWLTETTRVEWSVAHGEGRTLAACAVDAGSAATIGCRIRGADDGATALVPRESSFGGEPRGRISAREEISLIAGGRLRFAVERGGAVVPHEIAGLAEGIVLLPAGPREALLVRERFSNDDGAARLRYRFLAADGFELARLEGPAPMRHAPFAPDTIEALLQDGRANDGMTVGYTGLSEALNPGATAFVQRSVSIDTALSTLDAGWTSVSAMSAPDATNVSAGPDDSDPSTQVTLPEVWEFTTLDTSRLDARTFYSVRDERGWSGCLETCSPYDGATSPPDDSWQAYLKIDRYDNASTLMTRDMFLLNDNDTGADPSIDVPFVAKNELDNPAGERLQVCFTDSTDGTESLRFFQFTGASPAVASLGVGDTWDTGNWTSCNDGNGLRLTLSSACDSLCYPECNNLASPRARGRIGGGAGFSSEIVEDGWMHLPTGNYLPALLMRQETNLEAGVDFFFGTCNLETTPSRSFDYFWINEDYGFLGLVSSPDSETIAADDWSVNGDLADGVDVTWGPFPPHQMRADACLGATRVSWALPADGSNLDDDPGIGDSGYVVAWGNLPDADALVDFGTNPNHTPLPGQPGYLAGPPGSEPTSHMIVGWPGATLDATVVSGLRYTDPDIGDTLAYTSAAQYRVVADPAQLDPGTFVVGKEVAPFVSKSGDDLQLDWPAVGGGAGYLVTVYDLLTKSALPCPAAMECAPSGATTPHPGGASDEASFGYRVVAVDACGNASTD